MKISKKRNKIKGPSINYSHIWHFDISVLIRNLISESLAEILIIDKKCKNKLNAIKESQNLPKILKKISRYLKKYQ